MDRTRTLNFGEALNCEIDLFNHEAEVVVIGGGVIGCSVAYNLAGAGRDVMLLESRNIASGASGRNGGQVIQLEGRDSNPQSIASRLKITTEGHRMLAGLSRELEIDLEYRQCGSLDMAYTQQEAEELEKVVHIQHEAGDKEIEWLSERKVRKLSPVLAGNILGARYRASDGVINPFRLTHGFAKAAKRKGAKLFTQTKAEKILVKDGKVTGVKTSKGKVKTSLVINAANAWAPILTEKIDILPLRQVAVVTERIPELPVMALEAIVDNQAIFATTQTKSGNLVVGGLGTQARTRSGHYKEDVEPEEIRGSVSIINRLFSGLDRTNIIRSWSGTMAITADGLPCIGPAPDIKGLIIAAGFSNGMVYAPITGRLVAEYVTGAGKTSLPIDVFDPARFYGTEIDWPEPYNYTVLAEFLSRK